MNKKEYDSKLAKLKREYHIDIYEVQKEYALSNSSYKIGDIVSDHYKKTIKIKLIQVDKDSFGNPVCVYSGIKLKKDGSACKNQSDGLVWQFNIKEEK